MRPSRRLPARLVDPCSQLAFLLVAGALALVTCTGSAQSPAVPPDPSASQDSSAPTDSQAHPYTLHVYTDLLQIPTLVLDYRGNPAPNMTLQSFQLQLDSGPLFHPSAVHPEGNEPLSLALVLDASGAERDLLAALAGTPGHGLPSVLLPHDYISVYAVDCKLIRSALDIPSETAAAHDVVAHALAAPTLHQPNAPTKTCRNSKHLWDAITVAVGDLGAQPGRRAILVLSDGEDRGSKTPLLDLQEFASGKSVAIFALREPTDITGFAPPDRRMRSASFTPDRDYLGDLAGSTGGLVLTARGKQVPQELDHFVTLLRSRYVLQFPRAAHDPGGVHHLDVHVPERGATVRAAGISFPNRDPALMNDPTTVPSDTSKMPVLGKRKP